jgi:predicted acetyltransferase
VIWKPRLIDADDLSAVIDLTSLVFGVGQHAPKSYVEAYRKVVELDRTFVVDDGDTIAGTGASYSFDLALPGGGAVPMAGVTEVGVLSTHRRQGILTALMEAVLDQAVERGEPVAGLTASEGTIYRRYGFGVAAGFQTVDVHRVHATAELVPVADPGRVRFVSEAEAATLLPSLWERSWRRVPGELSRKPSWWEALALDPEDDRDGASGRYVVVHDDAGGTPDGFAIYRIKHGETNGRHDSELQIHELSAGDDAVEAALLRYLLDVDLVDRVRWPGAPVDLPLRWRLADSRAVDVIRERDHLWLRVLDVVACLEARSYAADGAAVIEVVDGRRSEVGGVFTFDGARDGAACARTSAEPDVVVDVATLGSLLLGGVTWATLQRAGLVDERTDGTVDRLDAVFRPQRAPYCGTDF